MSKTDKSTPGQPSIREQLDALYKSPKGRSYFSGMPIEQATGKSDFGAKKPEKFKNALKEFDNLDERGIQKKSEPENLSIGIRKISIKQNVEEIGEILIDDNNCLMIKKSNGETFYITDQNNQKISVRDENFISINNFLFERKKGIFSPSNEQNGKPISGDNFLVFNDKSQRSINQTSNQPRNDPAANKQGTQSKTGEAPKLQQPNGQQKTDETSKTSKIEDKKEANNDDDSGINMAEFFRAKENIDAHIETKGKGDGLDDALVKCLSKTPGVRIIRKGIFGRFGEPAAIKYCGVTMSFHKGHVVASGEGNVREIVQDLLTKIKPTDTASGNSEHKDAEVNPETGELTVGGCKYIFPVPRKDVIVLIQNSDGDSAFDPDELKKSTSLTYKAANQLMILSKTSTLFPQCCPDLNAESITQMKNNSTDPERSKNNVYPFARKMFNAVSERLNVVSSWVDNSADNILQQNLKIANPDLLLNIYDAVYEQYAQEEEATKDQQNQARDINERAKEIAERTINEYNLLSGRKLKEDSETAAKAFLGKLYSKNKVFKQRISTLKKFNNDPEGTHLDTIQTIAQTKNAIMRSVLGVAKQPQPEEQQQNAPALNTDVQVQQPPAEWQPQNVEQTQNVEQNNEIFSKKAEKNDYIPGHDNPFGENDLYNADDFYKNLNHN